jgi:hypothetical protein
VVRHRTTPMAPVGSTGEGQGAQVVLAVEAGEARLMCAL